LTSPELATFLRSRASTFPALPVVTGFDGFVDEVIDLVDTRTALDSYQRVETIDAFGDLAKAAAGKSSLREIVIKQADPGGCAINMGEGLAKFGLPVTSFATVGNPVHPVFADYASRAELYSWGDEPGRTLAFEFADGKLMFSSVQPLSDFTPEHIQRCLKDGHFVPAVENAKLIAITDWTLYPHMTACWKLLREEVFEKLSQPACIFFDLVDPSSRSPQDIRDMLSELTAFAGSSRVVLGLNENEATLLCKNLGLSIAHTQELSERARCLREALQIQEVVIHAHKVAVVDNQTEQAGAETIYCPRPIKSTGAGDRFNAGYVLGLLLNLPASARLILGNASSSFYVHTGRSASLEELAGYIEV
jgi:sugar/nucleoside kinase (ribokinase family)